MLADVRKLTLTRVFHPTLSDLARPATMMPRVSRGTKGITMAEPSQAFTAQQLGWMRRWHSQAHLRTKSATRPNSAKEWEDLLNEIEASIAKDQFSFAGLRWHSVRRKLALSTNLLEDTLVVRKINDNLRRAYGLRQPNRTSLIRTAKQALRESTPKTILRIDLRQCFESICRNGLLRQIGSDARLSTQTTALLDAIFKHASRKLSGSMPTGIPRGLTISTSLAEIKLRSLDRELRVLTGSYLYLRYVDDILIFSTSSESQALQAAREVIARHGFKVNERKTSTIRVGCGCELSCMHGADCLCANKCNCLSESTPLQELEYLGYKLLFHKHNKKKEDSINDVFCVLSDRKSKRVKTRVIQSCYDCRSTLDWDLLEDRILYLMANQRVAVSPGKRGLFNGLAYTHAEYYAPPSFTGSGSLRELDNFYRAQLRKLLKVTGANPANLKRLEALTFASGFAHRRRTKFPGKRVKQIQACWET